MLYVIKKGDTLSAISKQYGITIDEIMHANPSIQNRDRINEGDWLRIPVVMSWWRKFWGFWK